MQRSQKKLGYNEGTVKDLTHGVPPNWPWGQMQVTSTELTFSKNKEMDHGTKGKKDSITLVLCGRGTPCVKMSKVSCSNCRTDYHGFCIIALLSNSFFMLQCLNSISQILGQPWQLLVVLESKGHIITEHN